jgi:zinc protease
MRKLRFLLLLFVSLGCATSAPKPASSPAIPLDEQVRHGVLSNGLSYYVRANARPEKRAALRLVVNAGSNLEDDDQLGIAHMVEHLAFNGTKNFEKQELVHYLERIGMRFGPDVNAYTSFDETVYMLEIPTDDPKIMETAFQILDDWAGAVTFDPTELDKERGVVVEEWRLGRGASGRIRDKQIPVIYHGSRYAERLPIGKKETLETVLRGSVVRYYKDWYRPELMAVIAVGDFDPAAVEAAIKTHFGDMPASTRPRKRRDFPVPDHPQTLVSIVTDTEATNTDVRVQYKRPREPNLTVEDFRRRLVDRVYDSMMIDRLRELMSKADPPFQFGFAASTGLGRTKSTYTLAAQVRDGGVERGLRTLLTEARRVEKHGFTATELERTKTDVLRSMERAWTEREKQNSSSFAGRFTAHFLTGEPAPSYDRLRDLYNQLIPGITLEEVNARADQWLTNENRVILVSGPAKQEAKIPDEKTVLAVFNEVDRLEVTPWVDEVRDEPLVARTPVKGAIVEESKIDEIGVTKWKLSNGVTVLLKPTDFKNDEVLLSGFSPGGHSLVADADYINASQASAIVGEMGTGSFSRTELEKKLAGKIAGAGTSIRELSEGVNGSASTKDIETMLQLVYLRMTTTHKDTPAFQAYLSRIRGFLENQEASPNYHFSREFNRRYTNDHPRRRFLETADLASIDVDRAIKLYAERFADASDFIFTIVGSFDPAQIRPMVEQWLGSLPSLRRAETWRNIGISEPGGVVKVEVRKGIEPKSNVRIMFHGPAVWSIENQYLIAAAADVLRMRLREQLREEKGGVYGVGAFGRVERRPKEDYEFAITFGCDPARVDELVAAVFAEIEKVKADPGEDYVQRVRQSRIRSHETAMKENRVWLSSLEHYALNDLDPRDIPQEDKRLALLSTDSIRETARKYLKTDQYVMGVLYPEKP